MKSKFYSLSVVPHGDTVTSAVYGASKCSFSNFVNNNHISMIQSGRVQRGTGRAFKHRILFSPLSLFGGCKLFISCACVLCFCIVMFFYCHIYIYWEYLLISLKYTAVQ